MSLIHHFKQIRDYRTKPVYPLWVILVLVVMGTMSGCCGYRPLAGFVSRHQPVLLELLGLPHTRLPSLSTLRRIMVRLDFNALSAAFNAWAMESLGKDLKGQLAPDSKSIKASLSDYDKSYRTLSA
ncbi:MAG: transposase family protein [Elainellaceae cyanobacterium]